MATAITKGQQAPGNLMDSFSSWRKALKARNVHVPGSIDFVLKYRRLKGFSFDFTAREYLLEIYRAVEEGIAGRGPKRFIVKKCVQSEFTETIVNMLLWFLRKFPNTTGIYASARDDQVRRVSNERFWNDAIAASPDIKKHVTERNVHVLRFDNGSVLYLYSAWADGDALRNIPADIVALDEVQDVTDNTWGVLESRMEHSRYGIFLCVGSPKIPGTEFERKWKQSTQFEWAVKCPDCGLEQVLNRENIRDPHSETPQMLCSKHHYEETGELDAEGKPVKRRVWDCDGQMIIGSSDTPLGWVLHERPAGRWAASKPQARDWVGFHISQYMVPWKDAAEIATKIRTYKEQVLVNEVEGDFFSGKGKPVTLMLIHQNIEKHNGREFRMPDKSLATTVMGIDWMDYPVVTITERIPGDKDNPKGTRRIIYTKSWEGISEDDDVYMPEIEALVPVFNVGRIVADMGYGRIQNQRLRRKFGNKVFGTWFKGPSKDVVSRDQDESTKLQVLSVDRSFFAEEVIDRFKKLAYIIPYAQPDKIEWAFDQWCAIEGEDVATGNKGYVRYVHDDGSPDHAFMTLLYCEVAYSPLVKAFAASSVTKEDFWAGNPFTGA